MDPELAGVFQAGETQLLAHGCEQQPSAALLRISCSSEACPEPQPMSYVNLDPSFRGLCSRQRPKWLSHPSGKLLLIHQDPGNVTLMMPSGVRSPHSGAAPRPTHPGSHRSARGSQLSERSAWVEVGGALVDDHILCPVSRGSASSCRAPGSIRAPPSRLCFPQAVPHSGNFQFPP